MFGSALHLQSSIPQRKGKSGNVGAAGSTDILSNVKASGKKGVKGLRGKSAEFSSLLEGSVQDVLPTDADPTTGASSFLPTNMTFESNFSEYQLKQLRAQCLVFMALRCMLFPLQILHSILNWGFSEMDRIFCRLFSCWIFALRIDTMNWYHEVGCGKEILGTKSLGTESVWTDLYFESAVCSRASQPPKKTQLALALHSYKRKGTIPSMVPL